jgi:hypothetical protein
MDPIIIEKISFNPNFKRLAGELKVKPDSSSAVELKHLLNNALKIAKPKATYTIVPVETHEESLVRLAEISFESRVLCVNLNGVHRAFPYIATCGQELYEWKLGISDTFEGFMADKITALALETALKTLFEHLTEQYGLRKTAIMNPGSLEDWPLQAQTPLFSLLGNPEETIGVRLTESLLMIPRQSVSGLLFETETDFVNCQLCPRKTCPNRQAAYDPNLLKLYHGNQDG